MELARDEPIFGSEETIAIVLRGGRYGLFGSGLYAPRMVRWRHEIIDGLFNNDIIRFRTSRGTANKIAT